MKKSLTVAVLLGVLIGAPIVIAQTAEVSPDGPDLRRRCTTIAVVSNNPEVPYRLFVQYLQRREDFQASDLMLVDDPGAADAVIRLTKGDGRDTKIAVSNHITGERAGTLSSWTDFPGMIVLDAMQNLESACPGSVRKAPARCANTSVSLPSLTYAPMSSLSACSHTSWIDNRDLYAALRANGELKQMGVELRPACSPADVELEVTHNLNMTVEWYWQMRSRQGEDLTSGRVIAFQGKEVGSKITSAAMRQLAGTKDDGPQMATVAAGSQPPVPATRVIPVRWLPYDFSQHDTQLVLYVDGERVRARDSEGNVVFEFAMREFRDARLTREWEQPLQLDYPEALLASVTNASFHLGLREPAIIKGHEMPFTYEALFALEAAGTIGYFTIGGVLAQVRLPWHELELVWDKDGIVKTVALEVPGHGAKQLVSDLHNAEVAQQSSCERTMADVAYGK